MSRIANCDRERHDKNTRQSEIKEIKEEQFFIFFFMLHKQR